MSASPQVDSKQSSRPGHRFQWVLLAALAVAFFAAWPLISEAGLLNTRGGGDSPFLLQRVQQMETAVRDGHFPVRWMPDANYGFGYPFFNYYAPLSIYAATLFRLLGFSTIRAIESAQVLGFLLAGLGMFLLAQRWYGNKWAALLASVAFTTAPFHLVNVYVRGDSLAEFWAMAFYPWVIYTADRLFAPSRRPFPFGRLAAFAVAYAALILSHNISALIFTPFLLLFIGLRWLFGPDEAGWKSKSAANGRSLLLLLGGGLLALGLAAWFFVPALAEQQFAQLGPVTAGYFSFANHFRGLDLVQTSFNFDYTVSGGAAFRMGLAQTITAVLGAVSVAYFGLFRRQLPRAAALFILIALALATFMITSLSRPLWESLPLLPFTQFPWRFLSVQAFAAALAIAALALLPYCRAVAIAVAVFLIVSSFAALRTDQLLLSEQDITAESLAHYEWFSGNIGSTVSAEYLPQAVQPRSYTSSWLNDGRRDDVRALQGDLLAATLADRDTTRQQWHLRVGEQGATIRFPTMAWPGWQAAVDGAPQALPPSPGSGLMSVTLPAGEHEVSLQLRRTPVRLAAELVSLASLVAVVILLVRSWPPAPPGETAVLVLALLGAFFLLFRFWPQPQLSGDNMTWDFAQMAYLHHDEDGVPFSSGTSLLQYAYDRQTVAPGERLAVTLQFSEANRDTLSLALASPATAWPVFDPEAPLFAQESAPISETLVTVELDIPADSPAGLVAPRLTLDVGRPLMPGGQPRGDIFLRPLRITTDPESAGAVGLDVEPRSVTLRNPSTLDVQLAWSTGETLDHNYSASLLLLDEAGRWLAQFDAQPGYGFLPSSAWQPGEVVNDRLALGLPSDLPQDSPLTLVARLYDSSDGMPVLTRRLGEIRLSGSELTFEVNQPNFDLPPNLTELPAILGDQIKLHGYELQPETDTTWRLTFYWQALDDAPADATRFVHLYDPQTEEIHFQVDGLPRGDSYPLSQWTANEIVADTIMITLPPGQTGELAIGAGMYRLLAGEATRLTAVNPASGENFTADRIVLPQTIGAIAASE